MNKREMPWLKDATDKLDKGNNVKIGKHVKWQYFNIYFLNDVLTCLPSAIFSPRILVCYAEVTFNVNVQVMPELESGIKTIGYKHVQYIEVFLSEFYYDSASQWKYVRSLQEVIFIACPL